jgi:hypothetical protein
MSPGLIAVGVLGAVVLLVTLADVFVTVFNYDGFTFLAARFHRIIWRGLRGGTSRLPAPARTSLLSLGSAAMLPATLVFWLVLEVSAFALMYLPGLAAGGFRLSDQLRPQIGTAYYLSAGDITSLTFGDVVPRSGLYQAVTEAETAVGLATVGLAVTYILTAFDTLASLNKLHGRVRRQATEPNRPATIVARYFHGGQPSELVNVLQAFTEDLENYDQGLRRYPIAFYFHTRRPERSIPRIFAALGDLIELTRWGLRADQPLTHHPDLLALADEYTTTVRRLQTSFVGPEDDNPPAPLPEDVFWQHYCQDQPADEYVLAFRSLGEEAERASGLASDPRSPGAQTYQRYREWLPFHHRRRALIDRVTAALGYPQAAAS